MTAARPHGGNGAVDVKGDAGPPGVLDRLRSGAWLDGQVFPPLRFHVPGIIPEGATLLVGPPKVGKSWLTLTMALAAAAGGSVLGLDVEQRPVLLLALEDGDRRLQSRCRTLLGGEPIPAALEYLTAVQPEFVLPAVAEWLGRHGDRAPLIILDTLGKVMPPAMVGESVYQRDYRVGGALKRLADSSTGAGLVVIHHDRKADSDDFVDKVSGSNGLAGAADTIVVVSRQRQAAEGLLSVTGRDVAEAEYAVRFDGDSGLWTLTGGSLVAAAELAERHRQADGLDERARAIVAYVTGYPEGVRAGDVAAAVGIDEAQSRQYLSRLADPKANPARIGRLGRGLYGPATAERDTRDRAVAFPAAEAESLTWDDAGNATLATLATQDGHNGNGAR